MEVPKFKLTTLSPTPTLTARSSASSETSKIRSSSSVSTTRLTSPSASTMRTFLPARGLGNEFNQRWCFSARSDFDLDQIRHDTRVTVCRGVKCDDVPKMRNRVASTMSALCGGLNRSLQHRL